VTHTTVEKGEGFGRYVSIDTGNEDCMIQKGLCELVVGEKVRGTKFPLGGGQGISQTSRWEGGQKKKPPKMKTPDKLRKKGGEKKG